MLIDKYLCLQIHDTSVEKMNVIFLGKKMLWSLRWATSGQNAMNFWIWEIALCVRHKFSEAFKGEL